MPCRLRGALGRGDGCHPVLLQLSEPGAKAQYRHSGEREREPPTPSQSSCVGEGLDVLAVAKVHITP